MRRRFLHKPGFDAKAPANREAFAVAAGFGPGSIAVRQNGCVVYDRVLAPIARRLGKGHSGHRKIKWDGAEAPHKGRV